MRAAIKRANPQSIIAFIEGAVSGLGVLNTSSTGCLFRDIERSGGAPLALLNLLNGLLLKS
jgi:hypothetical protein